MSDTPDLPDAVRTYVGDPAWAARIHMNIQHLLQNSSYAVTFYQKLGDFHRDALTMKGPDNV
jgi:hypothetical protein